VRGEEAALRLERVDLADSQDHRDAEEGGDGVRHQPVEGDREAALEADLAARRVGEAPEEERREQPADHRDDDPAGDAELRLHRGDLLDLLVVDRLVLALERVTHGRFHVDLRHRQDLSGDEEHEQDEQRRQPRRPLGERAERRLR
jgi:hypothetical protein